MCYAIPGKITSQKDNIAIIDYFGEERKVLNEFKDIGVGDYVYAQGGIVLVKVPEAEAEKTLLFWKDKFVELKEIDKDISKVEEVSSNKNLIAILQKVNHGKELEKADVSFLLELKDPQELKLLFDFANNLRQKKHDNACCVHGIIEFSNYCEHDCLYCGIRKSSNIHRYRMDEDQIFNVAKNSVEKFGFRAFVIQSGEDSWYTEERLIRIVKSIRELGVLIFISVGIRSKETYDRLYEAGARGVLLRFETSNEKIFERMRPGTNLQERLDLIKWLQKRGYLVATGFLVGLPGETNEDIVNNIFLTKEIGAEMYSFGPLIPSAKTPLENEKKVDKDLMLKIIAICRLVDFKSKILVTSALETLSPEARREGLLAGANSLMINATPKSFKDAYELYPGRPDKDKDIALNIKETVDLLYSIGRAPTDLGL